MSGVVKKGLGLYRADDITADWQRWHVTHLRSGKLLVFLNVPHRHTALEISDVVVGITDWSRFADIPDEDDAFVIPKLMGIKHTLGDLMQFDDPARNDPRNCLLVDAWPDDPRDEARTLH